MTGLLFASFMEQSGHSIGDILPIGRGACSRLGRNEVSGASGVSSFSPDRVPVNPSPFVPTAFQLRILEGLKHKIRTATQLQRELGCDRKRLYRSGLNELMKQGKVANKRGPNGGYYRPDALPAKYAEISGGN
jgi:hypothetical protein